MTKTTLLRLLAASLIFTSGFLIGKRHSNEWGKCPYLSTDRLHYGQDVKVKKEYFVANFYNTTCKNMTVIGFAATDSENIAWVKLENCNWSKERIVLDTFTQESLEAK